jgi:glycosyltransferase involved in cell wall biosynthesis
MAAGLPVVCFDNPCERSIVRHGVDGLLAKDDEEFIRHVEGLHGDEWLRQAMGRSARLRALELYSTEKMVRAWEAIFEEVCHG